MSLDIRERHVKTRDISIAKTTYLDLSVHLLGGNSSNSLWIFFADVFGRWTFIAIFVDERDTHTLLHGQAIALLRMDVATEVI